MQQGDLLGGRYRLVRQLGKGGFGVVWLAVDTVLHREVAVKLLRAEHAADRELVERFVREARAAGGLNNPHIVTVHDYGRIVDGDGETHYLVMEYVQGRALSEVLGARPLPEHALALKWMVHVCKALDAAHRKGIVHRDIKPQNVMIDAEDRAKVVDFGIARLLGQSGAGLTSAGVVVGTVPYLAPECWGDGVIDGRADLYALGIMMYEVCAGERPIRSDTPIGYMTKHATEIPPRLRSIDPALADLVADLLAKDPNDRPAGAAEVRERLRGIRPGMLGPGDLTAEELRRRVDQAWRRGEEGEYGQAVEMIVEMLPRFARICGPTDPRTLRTCHDLALWLARDGRPGVAVALLRELLPGLAGEPAARADVERDLRYWQAVVDRDGEGEAGPALALTRLLEGV
ncbi:serine/threonine-protein kinase [Streptomyces sp. NRRL WC-3742]|uniref:serine/threonine-protein kinase n=1 Tax=Streptomyces sp. NRRL WC-3742 TaxID=1463934 RepID=UPI00068C3612|nr:serine/threonine-protein kinase [Streptomyces sp. NRRL WC-3742]